MKSLKTILISSFLLCSSLFILCKVFSQPELSKYSYGQTKDLITYVHKAARLFEEKKKFSFLTFSERSWSSKSVMTEATSQKKYLFAFRKNSKPLRRRCTPNERCLEKVIGPGLFTINA